MTPVTKEMLSAVYGKFCDIGNLLENVEEHIGAAPGLLREARVAVARLQFLPMCGSVYCRGCNKPNYEAHAETCWVEQLLKDLDTSIEGLTGGHTTESSDRL